MFDPVAISNKIEPNDAMLDIIKKIALLTFYLTKTINIVEKMSSGSVMKNG